MNHKINTIELNFICHLFDLALVTQKLSSLWPFGHFCWNGQICTTHMHSCRCKGKPADLPGCVGQILGISGEFSCGGASFLAGWWVSV